MSKLGLFLAIKNEIIAKLPEIKTVKRWNTQIEPENEDREEPILYPAVFIQMPTITWGQYQGGLQKGEVTVLIHIVSEKYNTEDEDFYGTVESVHKIINGFEKDFFSPLVRTEEVEDDDHDNCIDWQVSYDTLLVDCSTLSDQDLVETSPDLVIILDLDIDNPVIRTGDGVV